MTTNSMSCELFSEQLMAYLEHEVDDATRSAIERHSVTCAECGALLADLRKLRVDAGNLPVLQPSRDLWSGIAARIEAPVLDIAAARSEEVPFEVASHVRVLSSNRRSRTVRRWMSGALIAASLVAAAGLGYVAARTRVPETVAPPIALLPSETTPPVDLTSDTVMPNREPGAASREPGAPAAAVPAPVNPAAPRLTEVQTVLASLTADYDREIAKLRALIDQRRNQLDPATVEIIEKNLKVIDTAIEDSKKAIARDPASRFLIESLNQSLQTKVELMRTAALLPSRT